MLTLLIKLGITLSFSGYAISTVAYWIDGKPWTGLLFLLYALSIPVIYMAASD